VGGYVADLDHLRCYQAAVNAGGLDGYLSDYCAIDHSAYLERVAPARLRELAKQGRRYVDGEGGGRNRSD
jgi:hypothetical protein